MNHKLKSKVLLSEGLYEVGLDLFLAALPLATDFGLDWLLFQVHTLARLAELEDIGHIVVLDDPIMAGIVAAS